MQVMEWWRNGRSSDLRSRGREFDPWLRNDCGHGARTHVHRSTAFVTIMESLNRAHLAQEQAGVKVGRH